MKKVILLAVAGVVLVAVFVQWRVHARRVGPAGASSSQIYIHGTPVCVIRLGESIVASVGRCEDVGGPGAGDGESWDATPFQEPPVTVLPPGHPPIGPDLSPGPDAAHRISI